MNAIVQNFNASAPANMDILNVQAGGNFSGVGPVAQALLANGFNVNALRTQGLLRKDEWVQYDNAVLEVAQHNLVGVQDLISRGLTYDIPNALGTFKLEWERISEMGPAELSMAAVTPGRNERLDFDLQSLPLPIFHKDFHLNIRMLEASRKNGQPLDTTMASMCGRRVSEAIEQTLFLGNTALGTNLALYGYTTSPTRNTGSVTASWVTATGDQMVSDILRMIGMMIADNMYGDYVIYVPYTVHTHMSDDYKANSDKTIMQRLLEINGVSAIKPSWYLTGTNVVMVKMAREVVDMIDGIQPMTVQWDTNGGFTSNFKVMAIMVPRIRNDYNGQSGIVHFS
jgi:uncharacterized linocin/CFP29 family protein